MEGPRGGREGERVPVIHGRTVLQVEIGGQGEEKVLPGRPREGTRGEEGLLQDQMGGVQGGVCGQHQLQEPPQLRPSEQVRGVHLGRREEERRTHPEREDQPPAKEQGELQITTASQSQVRQDRSQDQVAGLRQKQYGPISPGRHDGPRPKWVISSLAVLGLNVGHKGESQADEGLDQAPFQGVGVQNKR